ncbi:MAG: B12-binding domain-containing radical SAM protein [Elusimicrobia bacterium]|nr:B12-binding domain-containing radical SAM protein [Elusimicrobiota bacterium]
MSNNNKINMVLISLYHYGGFGIRTLHDILKSRGHKVSNIFFKKDKTNAMELPTEHEKDLLADLIKKINPDIIGISTRSTFFPVAKDITVKLKQTVNAPVIWGGAHPTICPEESIQFADMICVGEGEKLIAELADRISKRGDITTIEGLWTKRNGTIIKNEPQTLLEDLNTLPMPYFEDNDAYSIENNTLSEGDPYYNENLTHYNFMTSRGCPFHCAFCSNSILKKIFEKKGSFIRYRSVDNVIEELKLAKNKLKKLEVISSNDEVFGSKKEWLKEFCERYKKEINLPFHCDIHPAFANENTISMLKEAGLRTITMGMQSGSEKIRAQLYGRQTSETELRKIAGIFKKYKVFPFYDLIFDNPLETEEDIRKTFHFMLSLPRPFRINMYSLQHHPRTELTERLLKDKLISTDDIDGISMKGFSHWHIRFDGKNQELIFLYKLFVLLSGFISLSSKNPSRVIAPFPRWFIRFMEKSSYFRKNPRATAWVGFMPKLTFGLGLLVQGKLGRLWFSTKKFILKRK